MMDDIALAIHQAGLHDAYARGAASSVPLRAALKAILDEPHGCVFCDSGKLRNPSKDHDPKCGFAMAQRELAR